MLNYSESQIQEMRAKWGISEKMIPVATAGGAIAWATKNSQKSLTIYEALREKLGREPTGAELKADVQRILREGVAEIARA